MKKIGFIIPWYGEDIPGGAETALRGLAEHLVQTGVELEILSTRVKEFASDWSRNFYPRGIQLVRGVPVRRFDVSSRNKQTFDRVNLKFMKGFSVDYEEEKVFLEEMVNSPSLYRYLEKHKEEYALFVFTPYMFGTTYYGVLAVPDKAVVIPCFHNESYVYMKHFQEAFSRVKGMIFLSEPERQLAERLYRTDKMKKAVLGTGIDTGFRGDEARFREIYQLNKPFLLYAGRKDVGKNIYTLLAYYQEYVKHCEMDLQLVLIGGGKLNVPREIQDRVHDLGFVSARDKYDACAAALALCNPSNNESFSIVIMESWLCGRPVLVSGDCAVTKNFVVTAGGGLYFSGYYEFAGALDYLFSNPLVADTMGQNGREYVLEHFSWDVIVKNYMKFFQEVINS